jgi:hypothetical protein
MCAAARLQAPARAAAGSAGTSGCRECRRSGAAAKRHGAADAAARAPPFQTSGQRAAHTDSFYQSLCLHEDLISNGNRTNHALRLTPPPSTPLTKTKNSAAGVQKLDHYAVLKSPLTTESAMKKIEDNNTLVG